MLSGVLHQLTFVKLKLPAEQQPVLRWETEKLKTGNRSVTLTCYVTSSNSHRPERVLTARQGAAVTVRPDARWGRVLEVEGIQYLFVRLGRRCPFRDTCPRATKCHHYFAVSPTGLVGEVEFPDGGSVPYPFSLL